MYRLITWVFTGSIATLLALMTALSSATAAAATPPVCPAGTGIVSTQTPYFARLGSDLQVAFQSPDLSEVGQVTVTLAQGSRTVGVDQVTLGADLTNLTIKVPAQGDQLSIYVSWNQATGSGPACSASTETVIPLIPATGRAGNPAGTRLTGAFAVTETYQGGESHPIWRFTPSCAYYACSTALRSSQGLALAVAPAGSRTYSGFVTADAAETGRTCTVPHGHPRTIADAYAVRENVTVTIVQVRSAAAMAISGTLTAIYTPTAAARRQGCTASPRAIEKFSGTAER